MWSYEIHFVLNKKGFRQPLSQMSVSFSSEDICQKNIKSFVTVRTYSVYKRTYFLYILNMCTLCMCSLFFLRQSHYRN